MYRPHLKALSTIKRELLLEKFSENSENRISWKVSQICHSNFISVSFDEGRSYFIPKANVYFCEGKEKNKKEIDLKSS